jgi:CRP-like cAMP-binding protein
MTDRDLIRAMASHPFLQGLSEAHLEKLAKCCRQVRVTAGELLGREKESARSFYLIQSGRAAIEIHTKDRGNVRIQTLGPGEIVGWSWLVAPHRWQFDARVIDAVQALEFDAPALRQICEQEHEVGYPLLQRLVAVVASRLSATRLQLLDSYR